MQDSQKTKKQLLEELNQLRREVTRLKVVEAQCLEMQERNNAPDEDFTPKGEWTEETLRERKDVQEALRQSERRNRALLEAIPDLIIRYNKEGVYLDIKEPIGFKAFRPAEELLGKKVTDISPGKLSETRMSYIKQALETGQLQLYEHQIPTDKGIRYEEIRIIPIGQEEVFAIIRDITSRKEEEKILAKRATEMETVARVSMAASTILDTNELLQTIVDLTKHNFNLYHAHLYLLNEAGDTLNLVAGADDVGRKMVAQGWSIPFNRTQSLVARAARTEQAVIVNDVRQAPDWLPNPLLPKTRSELAVPMIGGDRVLGVLDVQADNVDYFTNEDARIQSILASQLAIALENARLFEQGQRRAAELREARNFLDSVIENLPVMLFVKDAQELRFVRWNKAGEELVGYPREEMIGKNDYDFFPKKDADFFTAKDREVLAGGELVDIPEESIETAHHGIRYLHTRKIPIYDSDGKPKYLLGLSEDITERKRTEEALLYAKAQQEAILDNMPFLAWVKDKDGVFTAVNKAFAQAAGLEIEEIVGKTDYDIWPQELASQYRQDDDEVIASRKRKQVEEPIVEPVGTKWIETIKTPIFDQTLQVVGTTGLARDITESKQAEMELKNSVEFFNIVINTLPDPLLVKDEQHRFIVLNDAMCQLMGGQADDLLGKSDYELVPKEEADVFWQQDNKVFASDHPLENEEFFTDAQGKRHVFLTKKVAQTLPNGQRILIGAIRDITDRKVAEEELQQTQDQLFEALQMANLAYWEFDVETQTFTFNDQFYSLLSTTAEQEGGYQMKAMDYAQRFVHPDDAPMVGEEIRRAIETGDSNLRREVEHRIIRADGSPGYILVRYRIEKDAQGRTVKTVGANQDITLRKEAEAERERLLEEVQAAYRQFVRREWSQFLTKRHQGEVHIEHQQANLPSDGSSSLLIDIQNKVLNNGKTKIVSGENGNVETDASAVVSPITLRGEVLGTVSLQDIDPNRKWTAEDIALIEAVSEQLALTLENLRLFDETQQRAQREAITRQIADKIGRANTVEEILRTSVAELSKVMGVSRTFIDLSVDELTSSSQAVAEGEFEN